MRERNSKFKVTVDALQSFLAVVDCGNFSRAAERVGLSQPAVSQQIIELEKKIGATLFVREAGAHSVQLTGAGQKVLKHVLRIQEELVAAGIIAKDAEIVAQPKRVHYDPKDPNNMVINIEGGDAVADSFAKALEYDRAMSRIKGGPGSGKG